MKTMYPCYSVLQCLPNIPGNSPISIGIVSFGEGIAKIKFDFDWNQVEQAFDFGQGKRFRSFLARVEIMASQGENLSPDYISRMVTQFSDCVKISIPSYYPHLAEKVSVDELLEWAANSCLRRPKVRKTGRIALCGSMKQCEELKSTKKILEENGVPAIILAAEEDLLTNMEPGNIQEISRGYFRKIASDEVRGILAFNSNKDGAVDLGMNTFAEIAVAFEHGKRIYLTESVPEGMKDELLSWGAIPLNGSLDPIIEEFRKNA